MENEMMLAGKNSNKFKMMLSKVGLSPLGLVLFVIGALAPLFIQDEFLLRLLINSLMFGALTMAFDFTAGYINIVNFGYAAFWGLGAYTSGILAVNLGVSPWLGMFAGAVMAGIVGFGLGLLTIRLGGIFASCMTWFVALAMLATAANWVDLTKGNSGLSVPPLIDTVANLPYYYVMFAMTVIVYIALIMLTKSKIGLAFRAIGQDLEAAASSGVNANKYKIMNFTISCAIAGLIGGFYAHFVGVLTPQVLATSHTVEWMAISYIGGRGTIWGALISALIMTPAMEALKDLMELRLVIYGALMIVVMIVYPQGLAGLWHKLVGFIKKKRA